jgi:hypothetical protein
MQHKDCSITSQQGWSSQQFLAFLNTGEMPYMQAPPPVGLQSVGPMGAGMPMMMSQGIPVAAGGQGFSAP